MQIVDKYIDYVKEEAVRHPDKSWDKILLGFKANKWRTNFCQIKISLRVTRSWSP